MGPIRDIFSVLLIIIVRDDIIVVVQFLAATATIRITIVTTSIIKSIDSIKITYPSFLCFPFERLGSTAVA